MTLSRMECLPNWLCVVLFFCASLSNIIPCVQLRYIFTRGDYETRVQTAHKYYRLSAPVAVFFAPLIACNAC